ncbi:MAG: thioredoxin family protein [Oscillospiraceae bacterium]|nr:thioredoxin family protein [Oscillospiraceae bacterium]
MTAMNMNTELFNKKMTESGKPVLVEFWAPWCVYCRRIGPALSKIAEQRADALEVGQVNIDEEPLLAAKEQIEVIPTLVLYQNGEALGSIVAPESKAQIEEFILDTIGE